MGVNIRGICQSVLDLPGLPELLPLPHYSTGHFSLIESEKRDILDDPQSPLWEEAVGSSSQGAAQSSTLRPQTGR